MPGWTHLDQTLPYWHNFGRLLVVCNHYEDRDCGIQSTDLFQAILVKCNCSDTRDFISFMLSELVATQRLHSTDRNYYARPVSSDCIGLVSWLDSWPINIYQVSNAGLNQIKLKKYTIALWIKFIQVKSTVYLQWKFWKIE